MMYYSKEDGGILTMRGNVVLLLKINLHYLLEQFWGRDVNWVNNFGRVPMGNCVPKGRQRTYFWNHPMPTTS